MYGVGRRLPPAVRTAASAETAPDRRAARDDNAAAAAGVSLRAVLNAKSAKFAPFSGL